MTTPSPLATHLLYRRADLSQLSFAHTGDLVPLDAPLGQDRAEDAIRLALAVEDDGYNVYLMGQTGAGKHGFVRRLTEAHALEESVADDLCYVNNFADAIYPKALRLPAGRGAALRKQMQKLTEALRIAVRAAFDSDDYRSHRQVLEHEAQEQHEKALEQVGDTAKEKQLAFMRTPMGFAFAPVKDGEILSPDVFNKLPDERQEEIRKDISEMEVMLRKVLAQVPRLSREAHERIASLDHETSDYATKPLFEELCAHYRDLPEVHDWLCAVQKDVGEHAEAFLVDKEAQESKAIAQMLSGVESRSDRWAERRYDVNLLVDRTNEKGAPVVYEDHPTLEALVGRIEHRVQLGNLVTDFTLIQAGALHRAEGGHLILDAQRLLAQPQAYDALKRALQSRCVRIESLPESLGFTPAGRLTPEPIALNVKVTLLGDRRLYYLLCAYDPDFDQLFKIAADFADDLPRTSENEHSFARMVAALTQAAKLRPLSAPAVSRVIEHASRLAEDSGRLSMQTRAIDDLLRESNYFASQAGRDMIERADVQAALDAHERRNGRIREQSLRLLSEDILNIATQGSIVGQLNGLSVLSLGNFAFGRPSRISCSVRMGRGDVIDIEREVRLGGPIHSKGVLILAGYLGSKYARESPLSLTASLVFEQSYGGVDGDSASLGELCALLSAVAKVPLTQRLAITGSINQRGEVQAIGGVNEKVEGFFDACREKGLTGEQGVIIPLSNARHLMLRADVVEAAEKKLFSIYAVESVDEALTLLSGLESETFHKEVQSSLDDLSSRAKALSGTTPEKHVDQLVPDKAPEPSLPGPSDKQERR